MHRLPRTALLAAALLVPAATVAACGEAADAEPAARATPAADAPAQALHQIVAAGAPGAIGLTNDGRRVRLLADGTAKPTDRFRAGSLTKTFVATVALQLVQKRKLSLTDTVERRLPGILPYGDHVTLRQLLSLTSGIPDNQEAVDAEFLKGNMTRSWTPRELVALVADKQPDFAPGAGWAYSNTNYMLAGLMIERVTGHSLGAELARRIFAPLHLRDTSFPVNATVIRGPHLDGSAFVDGKLRDVTVLNPSGTWGAGNLVSSAADIGHFWRALLGGKLLAPAQLTAMKTTVPAFEGTNSRYGLGIIETPTACGSLWGHGGSIAGYTHDTQNSEDGTRQGTVIIAMNPESDEVGEGEDPALDAMMTAALGRSC
jgi:D-alanyl-D-alanine carboxypeptidase